MTSLVSVFREFYTYTYKVHKSPLPWIRHRRLIALIGYTSFQVGCILYSRLTASAC